MPYWAPLPDGLSQAERQLVEGLRALKDARRLTFKQMGGLTHYSHASWERWLNGKRPITHQAVAALLKAVGEDAAPLLRYFGDARGSLPGSDGSGIPAPSDGPSTAVPAAAPRLAQLPMDVVGFTGRRQQVRELAEVLQSSDTPGGQVSIAVVTGGGGLGKTALAVHVAHLVAHRFPGGQLYADLRAAGPVPRDPRSVLAGWLRHLGQTVDPSSDLDEMAAHWRSTMCGRQMLILLDNARDAGQVGPLLPATGTCAVVVTSRRRLAEIPGTHTVALAPLSDEEATDLLALRAGAARLAADPAAASELIGACGGIPLAVQIAGARLAAREAWPVATLATRLLDERRRLDELSIGELAVRASFQISYAALRADVGLAAPTRAFRLLGLAPGTDISLPAAAALLGTDEVTTERALEVLVDAHLLGTPAPRRYHLHDLLRLYAAELAEREEPRCARDEAVRRIVHWYLSGAAEAIAGRPASQPGRTQDGALADQTRQEAQTWYEAEHANLIGAISQAVDAVFESTRKQSEATS